MEEKHSVTFVFYKETTKKVSWPSMCYVLCLSIRMHLQKKLPFHLKSVALLKWSQCIMSSVKRRISAFVCEWRCFTVLWMSHIRIWYTWFTDHNCHGLLNHMRDDIARELFLLKRHFFWWFLYVTVMGNKKKAIPQSNVMHVFKQGTFLEIRCLTSQFRNERV